MKFLWTTVHVKNLDESVPFYTEIVGLKVIRRFPAGQGVEIAFMGNGTSGETLLELVSDRKEDRLFHGESVSIGFSVPSADAMTEYLKKKQISIVRGPFESPSFKFFYIKDPDGFNVQFFEEK